MQNYHYTDGLESERLTTSFLTLDDVPLWSHFFENEEAVTFIQDFEPAKSMEHAEVWIERQMQRTKNNQYGLQALLNKSTGEFIGMCGLLLQEVDGKLELEIGYHLLRNFWGKGYAGEAAQLFKEYAHVNNLGTSVVSIIHINNLRSQKVAITNNMKREKQTTWRDKDVYVYRTSI
ncbi:MAG: GNAT family N-acetyltransferase [bacterium]|nr:GNAT family N-acetyltransferase [bacterium]